MNTEEWIKHEQMLLWTDLDNAIRYANNGVWSMGCESVSLRIITAARLVGATPWGEIAWGLSAGGVYQAILDIAGVPPVLPESEKEWVEAELLMQKYGGTRAEATARLARTVAAIAESADWLRSEADGV